MIKNISAEVGHQQINVAVVVEVAGGDAHAVHSTLQAVFFCDIGESAVAIVVIQAVPKAGIRLVRRGARRHGILELGSVYEKQVEPAVVVVVEHSDTAAHRLRQIFFTGAARFLFEANA